MKYERWSGALLEWAAADGGGGGELPALAAAVLRARGIAPGAETRAFLASGPALLHDPFLLRDMDKAVARIESAIASGETIAVYGDYDVDGITATCLLSDFLRRRGATVVHYIPDRMEEGYGLNRDAVAALHARGAGLIVTVDCGITAVEETAYAASLGVDVVITDHHACKEQLPDAVAVVDPHRKDCGYPFPYLAGVGVALKLALALGARQEDYIDLAAIGTVADVMCLTGENRAIVTMGIQALGQSCRLGLRLLLEEAGLEGRTPSSSIIGYGLAPRINAAGRMGRAQVAYDLLETDDPVRAEALARELCDLNRERQGVEGKIYDSCTARIEAEEGRRPCIVLDGRDWHQGVVGIVASRLTEQYCCPAFMICLFEGRDWGKGSCRSYGGVNLVQALEHCSDLLESFGGHALAAGFTILEENIPAFRERMEAYVAERAAREEMVSTLAIDVVLEDAAVLTVPEVEGLAVLEPHGAGNPRPVFELRGCLVQQASDVGNGRHLKLKLNCGGTVLDAIFFSANLAMAQLAPGDRVDVAFLPQMNEYRGVRTVQMQICDLRPSRRAARAYQSLAERLQDGQALTEREARRLLPSRDEFAAVWRYLSRRERVAQQPERLVEQVGGVDYLRTMMCLDVLSERGLICMEREDGILHVSTLPPDGKVDLEESHLMRRLRALIH